MTEPTSTTPTKPLRSPPLRPAKSTEIAQVHTWLTEAIDTSPYYSDTFKQFEKSRLSAAYLHRLHEANPGHIMLVVSKDEPAGFMISSPEYGTLWLHWSYILPEKRRGTLAMSSMRAFIEHWDNDRFHKIATFTKPGNDVAEVLMKRYGYAHVHTFEQHIFGEDYLLYERPLNKIIDGYDHGISHEGLMGRLKRRAAALLGRAA